MNRLSLKNIFLTSIITSVTIAAILLFPACHSIEKWESDPQGNFDALWTILDEHYCFFEDKNIDWNDIYASYRSKVKKEMELTWMAFIAPLPHQAIAYLTCDTHTV